MHPDCEAVQRHMQRNNTIIYCHPKFAANQSEGVLIYSHTNTASHIRPRTTGMVEACTQAHGKAQHNKDMIIDQLRQAEGDKSKAGGVSQHRDR